MALPRLDHPCLPHQHPALPEDRMKKQPSQEEQELENCLQDILDKKEQLQKACRGDQ
jgi:hypothetical protein